MLVYLVRMGVDVLQPVDSHYKSDIDIYYKKDVLMQIQLVGDIVVHVHRGNVSSRGNVSTR